MTRSRNTPVASAKHRDLGAEIGISTTRLHSYGPMGADALTIERFVLRGHGEVRHPESRANA